MSNAAFCSLESHGDGYRIALELADYLAGVNVCRVGGRVVIPVCPTDVPWPAGPVVFGAGERRLGEVQVRDGVLSILLDEGVLPGTRFRDYESVGG